MWKLLTWRSGATGLRQCRELWAPLFGSTFHKSFHGGSKVPLSSVCTRGDDKAKSSKKLKKRKVALVLGYIGTNYRGLQAQAGEKAGELDDTTVEKYAVEEILTKALHASGFLAPTNNLERSNISRSSRIFPETVAYF